jgi:biotin transporter BioY
VRGGEELNDLLFAFFLLHFLLAVLCVALFQNRSAQYRNFQRAVFSFAISLLIFVLPSLMLGPPVIQEVAQPSEAWNKGVRAGMILAAVNGIPVTSVPAAREA